VRQDGAAAIEATALPLGLFCSGEYPATRIRLDPGDALVLYTDGLSEARNRSDEEYGPERLTLVLKGAHGQPPDGVTSTCLADLEGFLDGAPKSDDVTLMVVRRSA
jgi:sigma-B regulation protein RsbU (phosphoserine phosphatase)